MLVPVLLASLTARGASDALEGGVLPEPMLEAAPTSDTVFGVVTDQTMTKIGRDFYQGFMATWRTFGDAGQYNLAVYERPSARWGSLVWVEKDHFRYFQVFIHPGRGNYSALGAQAAELVYGRIAQTEAEKLLFKNPDLGNEEF